MLRTIQERLAAIDAPIRKLSASEAAQEIATNNGLMIDVREPSEHSNSPAEGAINIPRGVLEMKMLEIAKQEDKPIYLHCASGARAMLSAEQLSKMGYTHLAVITCDVPTIQQTFS